MGVRGAMCNRRIGRNVLPETVIKRLGLARSHRFESAVEALLLFGASVPESASSITYKLVPLNAETDEDATRELELYLNQNVSDNEARAGWSYLVGTDDDGRRFGMATPLSPKRAAVSSKAWQLDFRFTEIYLQLAAWWLVQTWRAMELAESTAEALCARRVISAAACARSLLESAAAIRATNESLVKAWDGFKSAGDPSVGSVHRFARDLRNRVLTLLYASRVGQSAGQPPPLLAKNVLSYIQRFAVESTEYDILDLYDWLCDAVHGSFGSNTVFTVYRGEHGSHTHMIETIARDSLGSEQAMIEPTIAWAVADATTAAASTIIKDLQQLRWLLYDIGMTSEAGFRSDLGHLSLRRPGVNEPCPCGSGRKFKKCVHNWGASGQPLSL